jgi:hypothetical protein
MKLIKNILVIGLVLLSLSSCKKDPPPVLTISVQNLSLGNISPSETISVESNYPWKLTCDASWISFTPSTGDGNATVTITAQDNLTEDERNANLIFTIGKEGSSTFLRKVVRATQSFPQLNLDIELLSFEKDNSTKSFTVNSNTSWSVEVSSGASWITSNKTSGTGNSQISVTASANTGGDRTAEIKLNYAGKYKALRILQKRAVNNPPQAPVMLSPVNNASNLSRLAHFRWEKSADLDNDQVKYELQVSEVSTFTEGAQTSTFQTDTLLQYYSPVLLKENTTYYWRVIAIDSYNERTVSSSYNFTTGTQGGYINGEYRIAFSNSAGTYPNELVFTGDGYVIGDFVDGGKFDQDMNEGIEAFFSVEPYKSYRKYFKVYKLAAYSEDSGVTQTDIGIIKNTAFNTIFKGGSSMEANDERVFEMVETIPEVRGKLTNTLVVLVVNQDRYAGTCWMWSDGKAIAISPTSRDERSTYHYRNIINHEAGGHGFGRLADEYITSVNKDKSITDTEKSSLQNWVKWGFYPNVDLTSDFNNIKWKHFIGKDGYAVGAIEGGYYFTYGVWRPETASCMIDNRQYYNAPSREQMVKRILRTAAGVRVSDYLNGNITPIQNDPYTLDEFVRLDVKKTEASTLFYTKSFNPLTFRQLAPPVMIEVR